MTDKQNKWVNSFSMLEGSDVGKLTVVGKGDWEGQESGLQFKVGQPGKASLERCFEERLEAGEGGSHVGM